MGYSTLTKWLKDFRESGDIPVRGSGNYSSDEQKEIARLKRKLRNAQDALDVLKKAISILGYRSWLNRTPSDTEKRREYIKAKIQDIYDQSKQNYGLPKSPESYVKKGRPSQSVLSENI